MVEDTDGGPGTVITVPPAATQPESRCTCASRIASVLSPITCLSIALIIGIIVTISALLVAVAMIVVMIILAVQ
jgi:hypothetical protein